MSTASLLVNATNSSRTEAPDHPHWLSATHLIQIQSYQLKLHFIIESFNKLLIEYQLWSAFKLEMVAAHCHQLGSFKKIQVTRPHFHIIILESLGWSLGISILKVPPVKANAQWEWEPLAPPTEERDRRPGPWDLELTEDLTSERGLDRKGIFFYDLPILEFSGMIRLWPEQFVTQILDSFRS